MGMRFRKSKTIAPGVKLNLGKSGASVRFGGKGAGVTLNTKGKVTTSAGIPGTGLSYSSTKKVFDSDSHNDSANDYATQQPASPYYGAGNGQPPENDKNKKLKKIAKRLWIFVGVLVLFLILLLFFVGGGDDDNETTTPPTQTEQQTEQLTEKENTTQAPTKQETQKPTEKATKAPVAQTEQPAAQQQNTQTYILNENTGKYHRKSCSTIKDSKNLREISADEANNYSPCGRCKP